MLGNDLQHSRGESAERDEQTPHAARPPGANRATRHRGASTLAPSQYAGN